MSSWDQLETFSYHLLWRNAIALIGYHARRCHNCFSMYSEADDNSGDAGNEASLTMEFDLFARFDLCMSANR